VNPEARGCQLSILVHDRPKERFAALRDAGVVGDFREPNVIRLAPTPLYNGFLDTWRATRALASIS
jgi:kynureninase